LNNLENSKSEKERKKYFEKVELKKRLDSLREKFC